MKSILDRFWSLLAPKSDQFGDKNGVQKQTNIANRRFQTNLKKNHDFWAFFNILEYIFGPKFVENRPKIGAKISEPFLIIFLPCLIDFGGIFGSFLAIFGHFWNFFQQSDFGQFFGRFGIHLGKIISK